MLKFHVGLVDFFEWKSIPESHWGAPCMVYYTYICHKYQPNVGKYTIHPMDIPWASTTIKIMVDPISMIKTLREAMEVISTLIVLMVVEILEFLFQGFLAESVYDFIWIIPIHGTKAILPTWTVDFFLLDIGKYIRVPWVPLDSESLVWHPMWNSLGPPGVCEAVLNIWVSQILRFPRKLRSPYKWPKNQWVVLGLFHPYF